MGVHVAVSICCWVSGSIFRHLHGDLPVMSTVVFFNEYFHGQELQPNGYTVACAFLRTQSTLFSAVSVLFLFSLLYHSFNCYFSPFVLC